MQIAPIPVPSPIFTLPGSLMICVTGQTNNGKSLQVMRLLQARDPSTGLPAIAPALVIIVEASGEGTMGEFLSDLSMCLVWPVRSFSEALTAVRTCFPAGRTPLTLAEARAARHKLECDEAKAAKSPPPPAPPTTPLDAWPLRALAVDSASTLLRAQKTTIRDTAREARESKSSVNRPAVPTVSGKDLENDQKRIAALATGPGQDFVDAIRGLARNRGIAVVVACHTRPLVQTMIVGEPPERVESVIGEAPDFGAPKSVTAGIVATGYADLWQSLAQGASIIWHCYATTPNYASMKPEDVNSPTIGTKFGAITERGSYANLGPVMWPKRQGGEGWLGGFDYTPRCWHPDVPWAGAQLFLARAEELSLPSLATYKGGPDLGLVLEFCLAEHAIKRDAHAAE